MIEAPLKTLSVYHLYQVIALSYLVQSEYETAGKTSYQVSELFDYRESQTEEALNSMIEMSSYGQLTELVALKRIGSDREDYDGKNWPEIYSRASIETRTAELTGIPRLGVFLEKGMQKVRGSRRIA